MLNSFSNLTNKVGDLCREVSHSIIRDFHELQKLQISQKDLNDFVINTELKAENALIRKLQNMQPSFALLLEEHGRVPALQNFPQDGKEYTWIVDPIDGTSNFIHSNPNFAICISLEKKVHIDSDPMLVITDVLMGIIYLPIHKEMFWAEKGRGAYYIDQNGNTTKLRLSSHKKVEDLLIATHSLHQGTSNLFVTLDQYKAKWRISGSIAIDMAYLAAGRYDMVLLDTPLKQWDISAGYLIISEAGGIFCTPNTTTGKAVQNISELHRGLVSGNREMMRKFFPAHTLTYTT